MQIGLFLQKFQKIIHESKLPQKLICEVLKKNIGIDFFPEEIKISKGVLYINKDLYVKNTIFFKKDVIISEIEKLTGQTIQEIK